MVLGFFLPGCKKMGDRDRGRPQESGWNGFNDELQVTMRRLPVEFPRSEG